MSALIAFGQPASGQVSLDPAPAGPAKAEYTRDLSYTSMDAEGQTADPWHLLGQSFSRGTQKGSLADYEGAIVDGRLTFTKGDAYHRFDDIEAQDFLIDPMFVTLLAMDGRVYAIQRKLLDAVIFRADTVVQHIKTFKMEGNPSDYNLALANEEDLRRATTPREGETVASVRLDPRRNFDAGDVLILRDHDGVSELVDPISRGSIYEMLRISTGWINYWAKQLSLYGNPKQIAERNAEIPWTAALAYQYLNRESVQLLGGQEAFWAAQAERPRDSFRLGEEKPLDIEDELDPDRPIKPRTMLMIAAAVAGGTAAAVAGFEYGFPPEFVSLVHATLKNWASFVSPVFTIPGYPKLMAKSILWMASIPPLIILTTLALDRLVFKNGDIGKTFLQTGSRAIAEVNDAVWRRAAQIFRQPYLYRALALRQRPWRLVQPDSPLGRRAGIDRATKMGLVRSAEDRVNVEKLLKTKEDMARARHALAHHLAITVVGREQRLDAFTVEALVKSKSPAARRRLLYAPNWNQTKFLLAGQLKKELMAKPEDYDVNTISAEDLQSELDKARETMLELSQVKGWAEFRERVAYEKEIVKEKTIRFPEDYGREANETWRTTRPTSSLGKEALRNFGLDFYPGGILVYLRGGRANPNDPGYLAAQAGQRFSTHRQMTYGNWDTARWWWWNQAAIYTRVYQTEGHELDKTFDPREIKEFYPRFRQPGPIKALEWWVKDAFNPERFADILLDRFGVSMQMIQGSFFLSTFMRWAVGGASLAASSASFAWHQVAGHIAIGPAGDIILPANEDMSRRIRDHRTRTMDALVRLSQGLRLENDGVLKQGVDEALGLFQDPEARMNRDVRARFEQLKTKFGQELSPADAKDLLVLLNNHPPLAGKQPTWLKAMSSSVMVYIGTMLGTYWDKYMFLPDLNWPKFLAISFGITAAVYTGVGVAASKWKRHDRAQRERAEDCQFLLDEPELARAVGVE